MYRSETRLYVNAARTKVVPESSPEAAWVLCGAGGEITDAEAKALGLLDAKAEVSSAPGPEEVLRTPSNEAPGGDAESKMVPEPPEDKAMPEPQHRQSPKR